MSPMQRLKPNPEFEEAMRKLEATVSETARLPLFWPRKVRLEP